MSAGVSTQNRVQTFILLVSTDASLAQSLRTLLGQYHYGLTLCSDSSAAATEIHRAVPTVILVDGNGPTLSQIRAKPMARQIPIVAIFPSGTDCDAVCVPELEAGVDQILCRPVGVREIVAHLCAIVRREHFKATPRRHFTVANLSLDLDQHEVMLDDRVIPLTVKEFKILHELIQQPNRVFSRDELLNLVWGEEVALGEHNLDVHIHSLRRKIESHPGRPKLIVTVRGVGYKLKTD
ncbi:MAG: response regulator transcription factor [Nitrospira sp.]|nr:MAG: response regulator transcription factor [Nitrospira sp.]